MNNRVTDKFEQELQGLLERSIAATMDTAMQAIAGVTKHLGSTVASHVGYSCRNLTPEMEELIHKEIQAYFSKNYQRWVESFMDGGRAEEIFRIEMEKYLRHTAAYLSNGAMSKHRGRIKMNRLAIKLDNVHIWCDAQNTLITEYGNSGLLKKCYDNSNIPGDVFSNFYDISRVLVYPKFNSNTKTITINVKYVYDESDLPSEKSENVFPSFYVQIRKLKYVFNFEPIDKKEFADVDVLYYNDGDYEPSESYRYTAARFTNWHKNKTLETDGLFRYNPDINDYEPYTLTWKDELKSFKEMRKEHGTKGLMKWRAIVALRCIRKFRKGNGMKIK